ncbi:MAG: hypothetical protein ACLQEQ_01115 [Nitrososphaerales archaeon]
MASAALLAILAYGHVLSAMGWLGGGILTTFVIGPNLRKLPSAASLEFNAKVLPRIIRFVQAMIGSTFLFGILLLYYYYNGSFSPLSTSSQGMELSLGIILALLTAVVVWTVTVPSFQKVIKIANDLLQGGQQAPPPDLAKYGRRARMGSLVGILLLLIVLATMISAGFNFY